MMPSLDYHKTKKRKPRHFDVVPPGKVSGLVAFLDAPLDVPRDPRLAPPLSATKDRNCFEDTSLLETTTGRRLHQPCSHFSP